MAKIDLLSAAKVKSLKVPGDYLDGRGLYLQVRSESSKSWLLKFSMQKRAREMGLGSAFDITLAKARDLRDGYRSLLAQGLDPIEAKRAEGAARALERAKAITFKAAAERYIAANLSGWKNIKHADQYRMTLLGIGPKGKPAKNDYCKLIRDLPIAAIDTALVIKVLEPIWTSKPETASRVRGRIESVINGAKAMDEFKGENPARWKGHLENYLPKKSKVRRKKPWPALPYAELPAFMQDLRARDGITAAALEFQILTAVRPGNALKARWTQFDRAAAEWRIAEEDMKGEKGEETEHKVPLSAAALAVLERMEKIRSSEYVFFSNSRRPLSNTAQAGLIKRMNKANVAAGKPKWIDPKQKRVIVPHGFRSTFRTWGGDETNFPREVLEKALAHIVGDETERAYDRGDLFEKRRKLMDAWAAFATSDPARSADVLAFAPIAAAN
jgi:integrase